MLPFTDIVFYRHVIRAAQNPINLDERQVNAVAARIELDLRIGAAFTRLTTLTLQVLGGDVRERTVSYGQSLKAVADPSNTSLDIIQVLASSPR